MEVPRYLQILWSYKWVVLVAIVAAVVAAFFSGFRIADGAPESKADIDYIAATTVLVGSEDQQLFRGVTITERDPSLEEQDPIVEVERVDLPERATLYAYVISGDLIRERVEEEIGPLRKDESIVSVRRTTQPTESERFPGRMNLPILDIMGRSTDPQRAELISQAATTEFLAYAEEQTKSAKIKESERVILDPIRSGPAEEVESGNPLVVVVITFVGVLIAFLALIFLIHGIRTALAVRRERMSPSVASGPNRRKADDGSADGGDDGADTPSAPIGGNQSGAAGTDADVPDEQDEDAVDTRGSARGRRRRSAVEPT